MKKRAVVKDEKKVIMTFTVVECGEYHSLGEYHEGIRTLDEAIKIYQQMPTDRMNGIPAIGISLHVEGTDKMDDSQTDILSGNEIDIGYINLIPEFSGNPQVQETVRKIIELFPDKEVISY